MNILKRLLATPVQQKTLGDILTVRMTAETPAPLHGIGFNLHWSSVLEYVSGSISWGDLFSGSDDVCNLREDGFYIERALMPDKTPAPAGSYTICTLQFKAAASGPAEITISDLLATRFREDVSIEQYTADAIPASIEIVMSEPTGKVIVRVEIL